MKTGNLVQERSKLTKPMWVGAAGTTLSWLATAIAVRSFSEQLPELDRIYYEAAVLSAPGFALAGTLVLSALPGRSVRRSLLTYAVGMALATFVTVKLHWEQRSTFVGEHLARARKQRHLELIADRNAESAFAAALHASQSSAAAAATASSR